MVWGSARGLPMVNLGVLGCGQWGLNHVRVFSSLPKARVVVACDPNEERLQIVRQLYPHVTVTTDVGRVLQDESVQAVVVASPSATHVQVAKEALQCGKDVLCEKPLTTSVADGEELVQLARSSGRLLMVGHVFVFNPAVRKLQEFVTGGVLGRLYYLNARRTNLGPIRTDVDATWDLASHDLSIFDYLLGGAMPVRVSATGGAFLNPERVDVGFVSLVYPGHIVASIQVSWLDPQKRREITVVGAEKMAIFNDVAPEAPLWLYDKGASLSPSPYTSFEQFRALPWERDTTAPHIPLVEPLREQAVHFLQCLEDRRTPQTDGENGLRIVRILEAISRSMAQGGQLVWLQSPSHVPTP